MSSPGTPAHDRPQPLTGQTILVTGGASGIGKATAVGLAAIGARVAVTGRDLTRVQVAAAEISLQSGNPNVNAFAADLSSQTEVRRLATAVLAAYPQLKVLINNAGGFWAHRHVTADGLEHTLAVNHLAPFLLTSLLLSRLRASAPARIITVSSNAHTSGRITFADLQSTENYSGSRAYNQSKLANVMFTYELARRLKGTGVTANALHPGVVHTAFSSEDPSTLARLLLPLMRFMKTPAQGAATSIYLASSPDVAAITGRYFADCRPKKSSKFSYDTAAANRLWGVSADLVGLPTAEPQHPSIEGE